MAIYLGQSKTKETIYADEKSPNQSLCITGLSGSGKTTRLLQIELASVLQGMSVVIIDLNHTHDEKQILPRIREQYLPLVNHIDPIAEGVNLNLFEPRQTPDGKPEPYVNLVNSAVNALRSGCKMGERQVGALRRAVETAIQVRGQFGNDADALIYALAQQDTPAADAIYEKLWTLLHCGALKGGGKALLRNRLNILDLSEMDIVTACSFAEVFLSALWRNIQYQNPGSTEVGMCFSIDEFQRLSLNDNGSLLHMLREGRKFSLNLLLATQTLEVFSKEVLAILNQTAAQLYFRPSQNEIAKIARRIAPEDPLTWKQLLRNLRIGESLAVGDLNIGGHSIRHPVLAY